MSVTGLNHVNIRTTDVAASAKFYVDLFDFKYQKGPIVMGEQSHWLYDALGNAIIHFRVKESDTCRLGRSTILR